MTASAAPTPDGMPRAVLFDLDGTLVHSAPDLAGSLDDLLAEHGLAPLGIDAVAGMIGGGVTILVRRGFAARGRLLDALEAERAAARFMTIYEPRATRHTRLMPGAAEALAALARAGVRLAVCTNKPQIVSERILAELGVVDRFDVVVGGDHGLAKKPDPAILMHALSLLGAERAGAVHVGDSAADVEAARAAGVRCVVVEGGYAAAPAVQLGADRVVASLADLPAALPGLAGVGPP